MVVLCVDVSGGLGLREVVATGKHQTVMMIAAEMADTVSIISQRASISGRPTLVP